MSSNPTHVPFLLRPVYVRKILAFAVVPEQERSNSDTNNEKTADVVGSNRTTKHRHSTLHQLFFPFAFVCQAWKEVILFYSVGTCLTIALPIKRFGFQQKFYDVCARMNELHRNRRRQNQNLFELDHNDFFIQILKMIIREWREARGEAKATTIVKILPSRGHRTVIFSGIISGNARFLRFIFTEAFSNNNNKNDVLELDLELDMDHLGNRRKRLPHLHNTVLTACRVLEDEECWRIFVDAFESFAQNKAEHVRNLRRKKPKGTKQRAVSSAAVASSCSSSSSASSRYDENEVDDDGNTGSFFSLTNRWKRLAADRINKSSTRQTRLSVFEQPNAFYREGYGIGEETKRMIDLFRRVNQCQLRTPWRSAPARPVAPFNSTAPLALACCHGNVVAVKVLLSQAKCDPSYSFVTSLRSVGESFPVYACISSEMTDERLECLKLLCQWGLRTDQAHLMGHEVVSRGIVHCYVTRSTFCLGMSYPSYDEKNDAMAAQIAKSILDCPTCKDIELKRCVDSIGDVVQRNIPRTIAEIFRHLVDSDNNIESNNNSSSSDHPEQNFLLQKLRSTILLHHLPLINVEILRLLFSFKIVTPQDIAPIADRFLLDQISACRTRSLRQAVNSGAAEFRCDMELKKLKVLLVEMKSCPCNSTAVRAVDPLTGNTLLHGIANQTPSFAQAALVKFILDQISTDPKDKTRTDFLNVKNLQGQTALECAWSVSLSFAQNPASACWFLVLFLLRYFGADFESSEHKQLVMYGRSSIGTDIPFESTFQKYNV